MSDTYQLHATGHLHPDTGITGRSQIVSKRVFADRDNAVAYIPTFRESCVTRKSDCDMAYMDPDTIDIKVVELDLDAAQDASPSIIFDEERPAYYDECPLCGGSDIVREIIDDRITTGCLKCGLVAQLVFAESSHKMKDGKIVDS